MQINLKLLTFFLKCEIYDKLLKIKKYKQSYNNTRQYNNTRPHNVVQQSEIDIQRKMNKFMFLILGFSLCIVLIYMTIFAICYPDEFIERYDLEELRELLNPSSINVKNENLLLQKYQEQQKNLIISSKYK